MDSVRRGSPFPAHRTHFLLIRATGKAVMKMAVPRALWSAVAAATAFYKTPKAMKILKTKERKMAFSETKAENIQKRKQVTRAWRIPIKA